MLASCVRFKIGHILLVLYLLVIDVTICQSDQLSEEETPHVVNATRGKHIQAFLERFNSLISSNLSLPVKNYGENRKMNNADLQDYVKTMKLRHNLSIDDEGNKVIKIAYLMGLPFTSTDLKNADSGIHAYTISGALLYALSIINQDKHMLPGYKLKYEWNEFSGDTVTKDDEHLKNQIELEALKVGMKIQHVTPYPSAFGEAVRNINHTGNDERKIAEIIESTRHRTRIYVLLGPEKVFKTMLYKMGDLNMLDNGEYMLIYVRPELTYFNTYDAMLHKLYRPTWMEIEDFFNDQALMKIIEYSRSSLVIIPSPYGYENTKWNDETNSELNAFERNIILNNAEFHKYNKGFLKVAEQLSIDTRLATYLVDAVFLYARALNASLNSGGTYYDGAAITKNALNQKFQSISKYETQIDSNGDASGNFTLLSRQNVKQQPNGSKYTYLADYALVPTGTFVEQGKNLKLSNRIPIQWATSDGLPPLDEPECGFDGQKCVDITPKKYTKEIVIGVLVLLATSIMAIMYFVYRNRKYEKQIAGLIWRIDPKDIQLHTVTQESTISLNGSKKKFKTNGSFVDEDSTENDMGNILDEQHPLVDQPQSDLRGLAMYRGSIVAIKEIRYPRKTREISRATKIEMRAMKGLHSDNVNQFMGLIVEPTRVYVVREFCSKGSLFDTLRNTNLKLDQIFIGSFIDDLIKGMLYLHQSDVHIHGNLKSTNCLLTCRWSLQVADFGLTELREKADTEDSERDYFSLLWMAPELCRAYRSGKPKQGTQKGDIYSFSIILHETLTRRGPFEIYQSVDEEADPYITECGPCTPKEVVSAVMDENCDVHFRPNLDSLECQDYIKQVMAICWAENPDMRPDFRHIRHRMKPLFSHGPKSGNIVDHMVSMMEKYQTQLEDLVEERTEQYKAEKTKTETLLLRMLPKTVANELLAGKDVTPHAYNAVTIYFSDIVGFTSLSADSTPMEVVDFLNALYTVFDRILRKYDVYKVETIGDAYMVVSGLPVPNGDKHAGEIASMALNLLKEVKTFQIPHRPEQQLSLRIGIHTGSCVAGVVGKTMPRYCLFGDTVNTASRMESNGLPLKIHCSEEAKEALDVLGGYHLEERGLVPMKGKGDMRTYWLVSQDDPLSPKTSNKDSPLDELPALFPKPGSKLPPLKLKSKQGECSIKRNGSNLLGAHFCADEQTALFQKVPSKSLLTSEVRPAEMDKFLYPRNYIRQKSTGTHSSGQLTSLDRASSFMTPRKRPSELLPLAKRHSAFPSLLQSASKPALRSNSLMTKLINTPPAHPLDCKKHIEPSKLCKQLRKRSMSVPDESANFSSLAAQLLHSTETNRESLLTNENVDSMVLEECVSPEGSLGPLSGGLQMGNIPWRNARSASPIVTPTMTGGLGFPGDTIWEVDISRDDDAMFADDACSDHPSLTNAGIIFDVKGGLPNGSRPNTPAKLVLFESPLVRRKDLYESELSSSVSSSGSSFIPPKRKRSMSMGDADVTGNQVDETMPLIHLLQNHRPKSMRIDRCSHHLWNSGSLHKIENKFDTRPPPSINLPKDNLNKKFLNRGSSIKRQQHLKNSDGVSSASLNSFSKQSPSKALYNGTSVSTVVTNNDTNKVNRFFNKLKVDQSARPISPTNIV